MWGGGRGRRFWRGGPVDDPYYADYLTPYPYDQRQMSKEEEIEELKAQAEYFSSALKEINKRLDELSKEKKKDS